MGDISRLIPKSELERLRLIREARAIYDSIFPPTDAVAARFDDRPGRGDVTKCDATGLEGHAPSKGNARVTGH